MKDKKEIIFFVIEFILIFSIGFVSNYAYKEITNKRTLDGLWLHNYNGTEAKIKAQERDSLGHWICVNIKGMDYSLAVETCQHEVGHEIFAEICEKDMDKCFAVVEELE